MDHSYLAGPRAEPTTDVRDYGFAAQTEIALRRVAFGCAIFLLLGPLGGRTMWVKGHTIATDAAVYNVATVLSGILAIAALAIALRMRPRVVLPVLAAFGAVAAFGLTVVVAGVDVLARWQGQVWVYAGWTISEGMGRKWTVYPSWGPPFFTLAALIGMGATLAVAIIWMREPRRGLAGGHGRLES